MINLNPNQNLNSYIHRFIKTFFVNERISPMCSIDRISRSTFGLISLERMKERKKKKIRSKVIGALIIISKRSVGTERNLKKEGIRNCVQMRKKNTISVPF